LSEELKALPEETPMADRTGKKVKREKEARHKKQKEKRKEEVRRANTDPLAPRVQKIGKVVWKRDPLVYE
jgi:hypothetical protein